MPPPPDEDGEFEEVRATDVNAIWHLFWAYGGSYLVQFLVGGSASVLSVAMQLVPAYVLSVAIDTLFMDTRPFSLPLVPQAWLPTTDGGQFLFLGGVLGASYVLQAVLSWGNSYMWNSFSQHFQHEVRVDTYDAMQRRETGFFDNRQTGEVMSILNNDVNQLESFLTDNLNTLITIVVRVGGMGLVMVLINWRLALVPVVVIPLLGVVSYRFVQAIHPKYQSVRGAVGALNSRLENNVGGIETVKAFTTEAFETERVAEASEEYLDSQWDAITTRIKFFPSLRLLTAAGYVAVFLLGGWWVITGTPPLPFFRGEMTAGTVVLFLNYSRRFVWPMRQVGQILNSYQYAEAAGERIVGLLEAEPHIRDADDARDLEDVAGRVEYDGVSFAYQDADDEPGEPVLRDVSFTVESGQFVGLVGPTGAGKSTTMKLLLRFYDPEDGVVRVDGTDVRDLTLRSLRGAVGYVSQEPYLFYGTVRENVAYGIPDVARADVERAARLAGAHEFVTDLEDGYDTMVGERGVKLSGGQRQRIALARAILRDPAILVLDEATSHVDNETERAIQQSLAELVEDRTTFAIAHRLSTVRNADTILVFDEGEIVERGTHEELLARDGLYADLWHVQVGEMDAVDGAVDSFLDD